MPLNHQQKITYKSPANLAKMIDKVAASLEAKGYLKEAEELDIIANTIDTAFKPTKNDAKNVANIKSLFEQQGIHANTQDVLKVIDHQFDPNWQNVHPDEWTLVLNKNTLKFYGVLGSRGGTPLGGGWNVEILG